jgi:hypothetical protein
MADLCTIHMDAASCIGSSLNIDYTAPRPI